MDHAPVIWLPAIRAGSGADVYTERLAGGLLGRGIDVKVTWFHHFMELVPYFLKYTKLPAGTDIIHTNSWNGFAFKRKDTKLIVTVHHCVSDPEYQSYKSMMQAAYHDLLINRYEAHSIQTADCVVAVSKYTADKVQSLFNITQVRVIYNGIDTDYFSPGDTRKKPARFRLLFVGNPTRRKGFDLLRPIVEKLGGEYELFYTGSPGKMPFVKQANVHATGILQKDDLLQAYRDCDAMLFPSRLEGFGYSVCEAMACGKPVITSDNSSLSEIIRHGETGLLCKTDNVDEFCAAARLLASDPVLAEKMGKAARVHVMENFTLGKMVDEYTRLYKSIL